MNWNQRIVTASTIALMTSASLMGCASANKEVNAKVAQETEVKNRADLREQATGLIASNPKLTSEQKAQLLALRDSVKSQMDQIQSDSIKLRAVLIREVLSSNYNPAQAKTIQKRMAKLDRTRTSVILDTIDRANRILGRMDSSDREDFMFDIMDYGGQVHGRY